MRYFLLLTVFSIFLTGCSSAPVNNSTAANTNSTTNAANSANQNSVAEMSNDNTVPLTMEEFMNANNAAPDENANRSDLSGSPIGKNARGRRPNSAPVDPNAETILTVAPDNSVITTSMNKDGAPIETRTFKSHPTLLKIERVYTDLKNPTIKVFLKNGKTFDLPKEKITDIFNVPADDILKAAGVASSK